DKGIPLSRLRKTVAFERLLARLTKSNPGTWILKGGLNMALRLGQYARTTKDIDLLALENPGKIYALLVNSCRTDLEDFFTFYVEKPQNETFENSTGTRYNIESRLDGRMFEQFHVDVSVSDKVIEPPDYLKMSSLTFANIEPVTIPCYSIHQQIAEKYHAMTRTYSSGESSRVKDLIDILALASHSDLDLEKLKNALELTCEHRNSHPIPATITGIDNSYQKSFNKLSSEVMLRFHTLEDANEALNNLLSPVFSNKKSLAWNQNKFMWE
ncbi:MAG: nucleotidyl transferase AbiEii/AbiGii toxin family protein, partial [Chloroflexi bacterium]|nr:nucleotidyl transferase AbiEii/AbiGii toxin family protein [Chloroflexota bacterium]